MNRSYVCIVSKRTFLSDFPLVYIFRVSVFFQLKKLQPANCGETKERWVNASRINMHINEIMKKSHRSKTKRFDSLVMLEYGRPFHRSTTCNLILCDKTATLIKWKKSHDLRWLQLQQWLQIDHFTILFICDVSKKVNHMDIIWSELPV